MHFFSKSVVVVFLIQGSLASAAVTVSVRKTGTGESTITVAPNGAFSVDVLVTTDGGTSITGAQLDLSAQETGAATVTGPADGLPAGVGSSNAYNDTNWDIDIAGGTALPMVTGSLDAPKGPYGTGSDAVIAPSTSNLRMATIQMTAGGATGTYHLNVSGLAFPDYQTNSPAPDDITVTPDSALTVQVQVSCARTIADANRRIFYNNSFFDSAASACSTLTGVNPCNDNTAIATDKSALNPQSGIATTANYISHSRSINGLMIDVTLGGGCSALPAGALAASNFDFKIANSANINSYVAAAAPLSIDVTPGGGTLGSDRIVIIWANNAIPNTRWLRTVVKSNGSGGSINLASDNVFYFGVAMGESLTPSATRAIVSSTDEIDARSHPHNSLPANRVPVATNSTYQVGNAPDAKYDYDKSSTVSSTDEIIARSNPTNSVSGLLLLNPAP